MEYNFTEVEKKWQAYWKKHKTFETKNNFSLPKYYVLDMFPYPSGAGLHVGHPLGYIASDIIARYKRHKGFNVLHPMGYDSFGLPAEQYAIETGQHPAITTEKNIARYREQLDKIGFSFDWDREVRTSDPNYYKWTQWIFIQLFNSWYNKKTDKAENISSLISVFEKEGNSNIHAACEETKTFTASEWKSFSEKKKSDILLNYRLTYLSDTWVNWCPQLGTVLANEEVKDGVSERGGFPVERKLMKQWSMRITAYAERLLSGLEKIDWSESIKEAQRNWIGKSEGTSLRFSLIQNKSLIPNPSPKEKGARQHWATADPKIYDILKIYARQNRQPQTEAEDKLWQFIRNNKLDVKFRRQHPIATYIADFIYLEKNLIIEIDGEIHNVTKENDEKRTDALNQLGFQVIRFTNTEIENNINAVIESIKKVCASTPSLLEKGQGGEALGEIEVFTTRPDTIFGVSFVTLAPEHELVEKITTPEYKKAVDEYVTAAKKRSELERQADVKKISGQFTGAYVEHPFTGKSIQVWVGDYVLAGYGTGAVMAVPAHDARDFAFAKHFNIERKIVIQPNVEWDFEKNSFDEKEGKLINSDFLNGLDVKAAIKKAIAEIEKNNFGKGKTNFRLRDAIFGRQRYWGEPIPVYYKDGIPHVLSESELPLVLPEIDKFLPTETGEPPLARAKNWKYSPLLGRGAGGEAFPYEHSTMPGWAGSSWYFLRYMDVENNTEFANKKAIDYWQNIDLYMGGAEHATGHLLYVRFWTKFLKDIGYFNFDEPAKKLINQGMIQGRSSIAYVYLASKRFFGNSKSTPEELLSLVKQPDIILSKKMLDILEEGEEMELQGIVDEEKNKEYQSVIDRINKIQEKYNKERNTAHLMRNFPTDFQGYSKLKINVDVNIVNNDILDVTEFKKFKNGEYKDAVFITEENGDYICGSEVEKMSKSKYNVVNPDDVCEKYGADCLRLYEMFLGPLEISKPWNTNGISGVSNFIRKLWRLYHSADWNVSPLLWRGAGGEAISDEPATKPELKSLHKTIKKITEDIERFSFNTSVSNFMICVNELTELKCNKREILEPLAILISPYAPHIAEELWSLLGHSESIAYAKFPEFDDKNLTETSFNYPVSVNGKTRFFTELELSLSNEDIEKEVMAMEQTKKYLEGKSPKKIIIVPNKIVNIVV